jgi:Tfp pilus assembly protein PilN
MKMIGILITLLIVMLLAYYQMTGSWPWAPAEKKETALERASKEAQVEGGPIRNGQEAKERVEQLMKEQEEAQKKMMEEASK